MSFPNVLLSILPVATKENRKGGRKKKIPYLFADCGNIYKTLHLIFFFDFISFLIYIQSCFPLVEKFERTDSGINCHKMYYQQN